MTGTRESLTTMIDSFAGTPGCFPSNFAGNYSDEKERREREKLEHNMLTKLKNKLYLK
jgi:hypothetical protein